MPVMTPEAASLDAIFDAAGEQKPMRDKPWGRPLLVPSPERLAAPMVNWPRNRKPIEGRLPYTRASSLANYVTDHSGIDTWETRSIIYGMGQREDLCARAAALPPVIGNTRDKSTLTPKERKSDDITNKALDEIGDEAARYANRDFKADWGTTIHSFTDPGPHGNVPTRMRADIESWERRTSGWEFLLTEAFVRNDKVQSAGTFDHVVRIPGREDLGAIVVDKKTGILHLDQFCIQGWVYASGELYDVERDDGSTLEWPAEVNQDWAILAHIPMGLGRTDLYLVPISKGAQRADVACQVRALRADGDLGELMDLDGDLQRHVAGLLSVADCRATMLAIAQEYRQIWTEVLTALGKQRLAEIES